MTAQEFKSKRQALGLTQAELAVQLDVHRVTIAKWETSADPIPKVVALALSSLKPAKGKG